MHVLMKTTTTEDNVIPYVFVTIDDDLLAKRVAALRGLFSGDDKPANVQFWSGGAVTLDWIEQLPQDLFSPADWDVLEQSDVVHLDRPLDLDDPRIQVARVELSMVVLWDASLTVSCESKYTGAPYEGQVLTFYADMNGPARLSAEPSC